MKIPFVKMQGLGNDFILIDDLEKPAGLMTPVTPDLAQRMCDRRFGVGADQILWLKNPTAPGAHVRMEILNSDGSVAEMCGNGIRAVALYLKASGPQTGLNEYKIETLAGVLEVKIDDTQVLVNMGVPNLGARFSEGGEPIQITDQDLKFLEVSTGNPHAVVFVDDVDTFPVETLGAAMEVHSRFPNRTNVEFVQILSKNEIKVRVWERGAGITLACGTGACASAVAALGTGKTEGELKVHLPGGTLLISWKGPGQPVMMKGPAEEVFRGEYTS